MQGFGIAYGTKEGRLRLLQHSCNPTSREVEVPEGEAQPWSLFDEARGGGNGYGSSSEDGNDAASGPHDVSRVLA
jgi:hypothetical protein